MQLTTTTKLLYFIEEAGNGNTSKYLNSVNQNNYKKKIDRTKPTDSTYKGKRTNPHRNTYCLINRIDYYSEGMIEIL